MSADPVSKGIGPNVDATVFLLMFVCQDTQLDDCNRVAMQQCHAVLMSLCGGSSCWNQSVHESNSSKYALSECHTNSVC